MDREDRDVLLLNTALPDGCGLDLLEDLAVDDLERVILMSETDELDPALNRVRPKVCDCLTKPLDVHRIESHLQMLSTSNGHGDHNHNHRNRDNKNNGDDDHAQVRGHQQRDELDQNLQRHTPGDPHGNGRNDPDDNRDDHDDTQHPSNRRDKQVDDGEVHGYGPLVGRSEPMVELYRTIARVAPTDATVLLVGESGTGKELIARLMHERSGRRPHPYVPLNCGAIPENLIESELFGHEKGAFTGASRSHRGAFERAHRGTLLLDEITEMRPEMQVRLLRVLETGEVVRIGGDQPIQVDVRIVAATNRSVTEAVQKHKLREDLLYRLSVFPVQVPPLRERTEDIDLLAQHFLDRLNERYGVRKRFNARALTALRERAWPGNVRQLRNALERAFIMADDIITHDTLTSPPTATVNVKASGNMLAVRVGSSMAEVERQIIEATLHHCGGDKRRTARTLGISLKTLYNRINSYKTHGQPIG